MANTSNKVIESRLLELAKSKPNGITNEDIKNELSDTSAESWAKVVNKLLKSGTLELFQDKNQLLYKYKDPSKQTVNKGSDNEEKIVFKIIEEAGNMGIWIRDIRSKSNLNMVQLKKVLKSLENKKIIKSVKSVNASRKILYMLYEITPDTSVTGGAWYQDQDFESEFVDVLNQQCLRFLIEKRDEALRGGGGPLFIKNRSYTTGDEVLKFISDLGISKISLSVQDIEAILYTLVLDNKAERTVNSKGVRLYRAVNSFLLPMGLIRATCGICPIINRCGDTGSVTPKVCTYLTDWLNE